MIPGAGLGSQPDLVLRRRSLAHEVDRARGIAAALQQTLRTPENLYPIEDRGLPAEVRTTGIGLALQGYTVVLEVFDEETARVVLLAGTEHRDGGNARRVGQDIGYGGHVLVLHPFLGDHRHRLGNFLDALVALADRHRRRGIGAAVLSSGIQRQA